jgi:L-malate glycosyltransferase
MTNAPSPSTRNIAIVSDTIYPYFKGGKEKRIFEITTRLAAMGYDVHLYTMKWWDGPKVIEENGVHLHGISHLYTVYKKEGRRSITAGVLFGLACLKLFTVRFDIVDVDHMPYLPLFSVWLVCKLRRKKMYATWHEVWSRQYWNEYLGFFGLLAYFVERVGTLLPDRIIVNSESTKRKLVERSPGRRGQLMSAYNGVDLSAIEAAHPSKHHSDIIYAGRLLPHKNVSVILKAVKKLAADFPAIRCMIVGDGPEMDRLVKLTQKLGIEQNVEFAGFLPEHRQVFSRMKSSKMFVSPSSREGFGLVVVEANACGLPVLTLNHPDNASKDLIQEGVNGFTFKTYKELAEEMRLVLLQNKGEAQYIEAAKQYDWQSTVDSVVEAYSE